MAILDDSKLFAFCGKWRDSSLNEGDSQSMETTSATAKYHVTYEECGHPVGECSCYDCAIPECDNFRASLSDTHCQTHSAQESAEFNRSTANRLFAEGKL